MQNHLLKDLFRLSTFIVENENILNKKKQI